MCFVFVYFPPLPDRKKHCKVWGLLGVCLFMFLCFGFFFTWDLELLMVLWKVVLSKTWPNLYYLYRLEEFRLFFL